MVFQLLNYGSEIKTRQNRTLIRMAQGELHDYVKDVNDYVVHLVNERKQIS